MLGVHLPGLEAKDQEIMEEVASLRAGIDRETRILRSIKGGLCPLLSERCLNMKEGQSLDQFFKLSSARSSRGSLQPRACGKKYRQSSLPRAWP